MENMTVNGIQSEINRLEGIKAKMVANLRFDNFDKFVEEVRNLLSCCGKWYVCGDYHAPRRYYSEIPGVKNIRISDNISGIDGDAIDVKVTSPAGYLLPKEIEIDGVIYPVVFGQSSNYESRIDY